MTGATNQWVSGNLRITRTALAVVEKAAVAAYGRDEEACGFLSGPVASPELCSEATEMENLANKYHQIDPEGHPRTGREYFKIHSLKFEKALAAGEANQTPVKVFFHSHLDCGAYFSKEDAASMTNGGTGAPAYQLAYLVTAVDLGVVTAHKLFIWDGPSKSFVESPFTILD
jgi:[CysO sulfur-carrier protein]-S-L-cysteine hydrolase